MKKLIIAFLFSTAIGLFSSNAQRVRVRLDFPVGVAVIAPGPAPFAGAMWIAPEWTWRGGRYVCAPGYWMHAPARRTYWSQGQWQHTRRGYYWRRGHWR